MPATLTLHMQMGCVSVCRTSPDTYRCEHQPVRVRLQVERVAIHEVKEPGVDPTKAVRIFVKFVRQESSMKALVDLNGRHFGGKTVEGSFFPEAKFDQAQLAPEPGEA